MAIATLVPLEEYLSTSYEPDCDYLEGRLVERNVGEYNHSFLQGIILFALRALALRAYVELRFQIGDCRFRVPDVLALAPGQKRSAKYQTDTPYIVVEILLPEDRISGLRERIQDYLGRRVPNIWVVDPAEPTLTVHERAETHTYTDRVTTSDGRISLDLTDIFRQLAEDEADQE
jgi:Uma2 family endonuclease